MFKKNVENEVIVNDREIVREEDKINWRDILVRSVKTFIQTTISYFIININGLDLTSISKEILRGIVIGGVAAGVCAVWNSVLSPLLNIDGKPMVKVVYVNKQTDVTSSNDNG